MFLFDMLRNGISRVCCYFLSMERTSEHFSHLRNDLERNSKSFLFHGMTQKGIPRVCFYFCSMIPFSEHFSPLPNSLEQNSEGIFFHRTDRIPQEQTNCSVYSVFCGIIILSEIANPTWDTCIQVRPWHETLVSIDKKKHLEQKVVQLYLLWRWKDLPRVQLFLLVVMLFVTELTKVWHEMTSDMSLRLKAPTAEQIYSKGIFPHLQKFFFGLWKQILCL